jgi:hypothetical protein
MTIGKSCSVRQAVATCVTLHSSEATVLPEQQKEQLVSNSASGKCTCVSELQCHKPGDVGFDEGVYEERLIKRKQLLYLNECILRTDFGLPYFFISF